MVIRRRAANGLVRDEPFGCFVDACNVASRDVEVVATSGVAIACGENGERIADEQAQGNLLNETSAPGTGGSAPLVRLL